MASGQASKIGGSIRKRISVTVRDVMTLAAQNVIEATPVDTGHCRSNWVLSVGAPYQGVDGSRTSVSTSAQERGFAIIAKYDVGRDGQAFLRNNVSYLPFLDRGWSKQAPANFVAAALHGGRSAAAYGMKTRAGKMLTKLVRAAYKRGQRP